MGKAPQDRIRKRVIFQASCDRFHRYEYPNVGAWTGPERERQYEAALDLAQHRVSWHGGSVEEGER